jgi:Zn-dependent M28 family amino/carboxypeptidase
MGLLGSDYFSNHPTVPPESLVADVNIDGAPGLLFPPKDLVALGAEHSTLNKDVEQSARQMGYELSPDPMPEEVAFIRSDQYSFVRRGVPAVDIIDGSKSTDPKIDGLKVTKTWLATLYHTPRDNMSQPFDFEAAAKGTQLNFLIGYRVAQDPQAPAWNPGDFFGVKFARNAGVSSLGR